MTRIVIDARESGTSTGRYIDKLVEYLHKLEAPYDFVILAKPERLQFLAELAPRFEIIETPYKEFTFAEQIGLLGHINNIGPDLVHFNAPQQPVLYRGWSVTTVHDLTTLRFINPAKNPPVFWAKRLVYRFVVWLVAHKSARLIAISNFVKEDLVHYAKIKPVKVEVIYESADQIPEQAEAVETLKDSRFIMYVGRPQPHKNLKRLIDAFAELKPEFPELMLALAGKTDVLFERHAKYVQDKGIKDVVFTGFVSEGQLKWMYENCAAYVTPSLSEGFNLPGLEAMIHGAPVVSSDATCMPEIYGEAAYFFDPRDTQAIVSAIKEVISDAGLRDKLTRLGHEQAKKYSWQRMAEQTLEVYRSVLG